MRRLKLVLTADVPDTLSENDFALYVENAVEGWSGQFEGDDPTRRIADVQVTCEGTDGVN